MLINHAFDLRHIDVAVVALVAAEDLVDVACAVAFAYCA